ncbi:hypothetical protein Syun_009578 [Stephania yunnanensis]|uniref:Uncharacterized protein n=1 Tax=Stephania yunnanensis TaxID=152371 RepID=A0AAP0PQS9_9MAGN
MHLGALKFEACPIISISKGRIGIDFIENISLKVGSLIDLSEMIFTLTYDITSRAAFGNRCKDKKAFIAAAKESVKLGGGFGVHDLFPSLKLIHVLMESSLNIMRCIRKSMPFSKASSEITELIEL